MKKIIVNIFIGVAAFIITFFVIYIFFQPMSIKGNSMNPTYQDGDIVFVNTASKSYKNEDIIVMYYGKEKLIKRIRAIVGDTVIVNPDGIYINDTLITENTENYPTEVYVLNNDEYFVLGDNYLNSTDSRYFGTINKKQIIGKVLFAKELNL